MSAALELVLPALTSLFGAALATAGTDEHNQPAPVMVIDGPLPLKGVPAELVLVGSTGDADEDAATMRSELSPVGNRWRAETGEVNCAAVVSAGSGALATLRARAFALVRICAAAIDADPTLAGVLVMGGLAEVNGEALSQVQGTTGPLVRVVFTVAYTTTT